MIILNLFSGIGSFEKAFWDQNNHQDEAITFITCEKDKKAQQFYEIMKMRQYHCPNNNFHYQHINDINDINLHQTKNPKAIDWLVWTPPCQAFSQGGKNKGIKDERGAIFYKGLKIIGFYLPKVILFENVPNLQHNHRQVYDDYIELLKKHNYEIMTWKLNPLYLYDWLPQNRPRLFIIAFKKSYQFANLTLANEIIWEQKYNSQIKSLQRLGIDFNGYYKDEIKGEIDITSEYKNYFYLKNKTKGAYNRLWKISSYCGTLTASVPMKITDGKHKRYLTAREYMLLMGWNEQEYEAIKTILKENEIKKLIGNSVALNCWSLILDLLSKEQ